MSSPVATKRRRINDAATTLSKPFVSPLRSGRTDRTPLKASSNAGNRPYMPSTLAHTTSYDAASTQVPSKPTNGSLAELAVQHVKATPVRKSTLASNSARKSTSEEQTAQRQVTALELRIRSVRNELDVLQQAASILSSSKATELEALAEKWRRASQDTAEELFGGVKERVNRMGGVAAWKETEKKKNERFSAFDNEQRAEDDDADCEFDSQGEELPEEEQEARKAEKKRVKQEMQDAADPPERDPREESTAGIVWNEPGKEDDVSVKPYSPRTRYDLPVAER